MCVFKMLIHHHHRDFQIRKLIEGEIVRKLVRESEVKSRRSGVDCFSLGIDCCFTKVRKSKRRFIATGGARVRKPRARFKLKLIDKFNYYLLLLTAFHSELIAASGAQMRKPWGGFILNCLTMMKLLLSLPLSLLLFPMDNVLLQRNQ